MNTSTTYIVKLILLGDVGTGKSCLLTRFSDDIFNSEHASTVGVDFFSKTIMSSKNTLIRLHLWDTAGQEKFRSIISAYYKSIAGAIILFDVNNRKSFDNIKFWLQELREKNENSHCTPVIILGNKTDVDKTNRKISFKEAYDYAKQAGVRYSEISVKNNIGINESILRIVDDVENTFIINHYNSNGVKPQTMHISSKNAINVKNKNRCNNVKKCCA